MRCSLCGHADYVTLALVEKILKSSNYALQKRFQHAPSYLVLNQRGSTIQIIEVKLSSLPKSKKTKNTCAIV